MFHFNKCRKVPKKFFWWKEAMLIKTLSIEFFTYKYFSMFQQSTFTRTIQHILGFTKLLGNLTLMRIIMASRKYGCIKNPPDCAQFKFVSIDLLFKLCKPSKIFDPVIKNVTSTLKLILKNLYIQNRLKSYVQSANITISFHRQSFITI